jgi:hypothetical protein
MNRLDPNFVAVTLLVGILAIPAPRDSLLADEEAPQVPGLYEETVLRTLHLEFHQSDWWEQLERNYATKVNLSADLIVDDVLYPDVGVRFKGFTSYQRAARSYKRSFNIEIDDVHDDQRLMGYRTLNLHNAYNDPSFLREVLYSNLARRYIPNVKANFVLLTINGESWGSTSTSSRSTATSSRSGSRAGRAPVGGRAVTSSAVPGAAARWGEATAP